ncbi:Ig-like domain-containing protein [Morganella psychrotolerans]|uniref:Ig-like domain-containing protein n=1 Tax=Morganella psychrotolerans TaxID=368603 RepID=UPI0039AF41EC
MSITIAITTTSGANANGSDTNEASVILKNNDTLLDNKKINFNVTDDAIFPETGTNETSAITNALGRATVKLTDTTAETVIVTASYSEDHSVKDSGPSTFGDSPGVGIYPPEIDEATNNTINLSNINEIAHLRIPQWNGMKVNDVLDIFAMDVSPWEINYTVNEFDIGNDIVLDLSKVQYLEPYLNNIINIHYTLNNEIISESVTYLVVSALISDIEIIGNRGDLSSVNSLVAINKNSLMPTSVYWQYKDEENIHLSPYFTDLHPLKEIHVFVTSNENNLTIVPRNVDSLGFDGKSRAYILTESGKLFSWGSDTPAWLIPPATVTGLSSVRGILSSPYATVVLTNENKLYGWGESGNGALDVPVEGINTVGYTRTAFAAITEEQKIIAWGVASAGGKLPENIASINGFIQVVGTRSAFCALHRNGNVYAWGSEEFGGKLPPGIAQLNNIKTIFSTDGAFAVLMDDGTVEAWGHKDFGGKLSILLRNINTISSNTGAFVALNNTGYVYGWGQPFNGGSLPNSIQLLDNIISVSASDAAFCVLQQNGTINAWGAHSFGAKIPKEILEINNFITISSSIGGFFAISKTGKIVMWNFNTFKINEIFSTNPKAGYRITRDSPPDSFICLHDNKTLSIIGENSDVSNISDIPENVNGYIAHSYHNGNKQINNDFSMILSIIKNNAKSDGEDFNKVRVNITNAVNKKPLCNKKIIVVIDGNATFIENNNSLLAKETNLNGDINFSIKNLTTQHVNIVTFISNEPNSTLHDVVIFT